MIVFVGDQPSSKNIDPNVPFVGTQSYKKLLEWIWEMDLDISDIKICNRDEILQHVTARYIVLGDKAEKTFIETGFYHVNPESLEVLPYGPGYFKLPHPSGRNRKLNDKKYIKQELKKCKEWLNGK